MTGGQDVAGLMDVPALTRSLAADGVRAITVCTDDVGRYGATPGSPPACRSATATRSWPCRRSCAAAPACRCSSTTSGARPRPGACGRGASSTTRRDASSSTRRCVRGAATARGQQLPVGAAGRDRVRRAAGDPPVVVQQGLLVPRGRLPVVRDLRAGAPRAVGAVGAARRAGSRTRAPGPRAARRRAAGAADRSPARRASACTRPGSAAPASSPPTGCWPGPRCSPATPCRASTRRACRRRRAPSSPTSTSPPATPTSRPPPWPTATPACTCRATSCRPRRPPTWGRWPRGAPSRWSTPRWCRPPGCCRATAPSTRPAWRRC